MQTKALPIVHFSPTFSKGWIAQEEVVAASCGCLVAPVWFQHRSQLSLHLVHFIEHGEDALVDELVWVLLTQVESVLQVDGRETLQDKTSQGNIFSSMPSVVRYTRLTSWPRVTVWDCPEGPRSPFGPCKHRERGVKA